MEKVELGNAEVFLAHQNVETGEKLDEQIFQLSVTGRSNKRD